MIDFFYSDTFNTTAPEVLIAKCKAQLLVNGSAYLAGFSGAADGSTDPTSRFFASYGYTVQVNPQGPGLYDTVIL